MTTMHSPSVPPPRTEAVYPSHSLVCCPNLWLGRSLPSVNAFAPITPDACVDTRVDGQHKLTDELDLVSVACNL